jgi:threonine dehydratase
MIRSCGAEVVIGGARYADAQEACDRYVAETGAFCVHPFDTKETIAGQGTVALEWAKDTALDTVLVAAGGGGLLAGIAAFFGRKVRVVGVEPEGSRAVHAALAAGGPVDVQVQSVAADSLGARSAGAMAFEIIKQAVHGVVLVSDDDIEETQRWLWTQWRLAIEPGGCAALAALRSGAYEPARGERVGILLCGANVDLGKLAAATA